MIRFAPSFMTQKEVNATFFGSWAGALWNVLSIYLGINFFIGDWALPVMLTLLWVFLGWSACKLLQYKDATKTTS